MVSYKMTAQLFVLGLSALFAVLSAMGPAHAEDSAVLDAQAYRFTRPTEIRRCTSKGDDWTDAGGKTADAIAQPGWKFYVVNQTEDRVVIQFLYWKEGAKGQEGATSTTATNYDRFNVEKDADGRLKLMLWCVDGPKLRKATQEYFLGSGAGGVELNFGVLVVPVKLRGGVGSARDVTFTTDVSLAGAVDLNWRVRGTSAWFIHVPVFAGVGVIQVSPNESKVPEQRILPALTMGVGVGVSGTYGGAGVVLGFDIVNGNSSGDEPVGWVYQGRPWLGVSLGATFGVQASPTNKEQ